MIKKFLSLFRRKPALTPEERLWASLTEFNAAWTAYNESTGAKRWTDRMRPWIDWPNKRVIMSVSTFHEIEPTEVRK